MAAESTSALLAQIPLVAGAADVLPSDESTLQWVTSAVALVNTKGDVRALSTELRYVVSDIDIDSSSRLTRSPCL